MAHQVEATKLKDSLVRQTKTFGSQLPVVLTMDTFSGGSTVALAKPAGHKIWTRLTALKVGESYLVNSRKRLAALRNSENLRAGLMDLRIVQAN